MTRISLATIERLPDTRDAWRPKVMALSRCVSPEALAFTVQYGIAVHLAGILADLYAGRTVNVERGRIRELRAALDAEAIDTTPTGYALTDTGRDECAQAISLFRQWVGKAA